MGATQHTHTSQMALSLFDSTLFPTLGRRMARAPFGGLLSRQDPLFEAGRLFAEVDQHRDAFLSEMNVERSAPHGKQAEGDQPRGYSQSFSYSSTTFGGPDGETVSQRTEQFSSSDGQNVSRARRSVGDKMVEEISNGGETTRTLHNMAEDDLEAFNKAANFRSLFRQPLAAAQATTTPNDRNSSGHRSLPAALEADLSSIQNGHAN